MDKVVNSPTFLILFPLPFPLVGWEQLELLRGMCIKKKLYLGDTKYIYFY